MVDFHPIIVQGDTVQIPDLPGEVGYQWFYKAVLDGRVPLWAPIGVLFRSITGNVKGDITVRNNSFMEAPLSMISNLHDVLFTGLHSKTGVVVCPREEGIRGELAWSTMQLKEVSGRQQYEVRALSAVNYFAYALEKVSINFYFKMATGYHTMNQNAQDIMTSEIDEMQRGCYLPVASNHTLNNFLRVRAIYDGAIKVQYLNGLTPELLQQIWKEAGEYGS